MTNRIQMIISLSIPFDGSLEEACCVAVELINNNMPKNIQIDYINATLVSGCSNIGLPIEYNNQLEEIIS